MVYNLDTHERETESIPSAADLAIELDDIQRNLKAMASNASGVERIEYLLIISQLQTGSELLAGVAAPVRQWRK